MASALLYSVISNGDDGTDNSSLKSALLLLPLFCIDDCSNNLTRNLQIRQSPLSHTLTLSGASHDGGGVESRTLLLSKNRPSAHVGLNESRNKQTQHVSVPADVNDSGTFPVLRQHLVTCFNQNDYMSCMTSHHVENSKLYLKNNLSSNNKDERRIRFGSVTVYHHGIGLGDSPSVRKGAPIALTWERLNYQEYASVDDHQAAAYAMDPFHGRRTSKQLRLNAAQRYALLLRQGVLPKEIQQSIRLAQYLKWQKIQRNYTSDDESEEDDNILVWGGGREDEIYMQNKPTFYPPVVVS